MAAAKKGGGTDGTQGQANGAEPWPPPVETIPGTPNDLLPSNRKYPTEVAYYTSVILTDPGDETAETNLETAGPIDLMGGSGAGFTTPAVGVRITTEQAWYAEGVTLGQLLHSVSLAPGESTRIAVVDWARRTAGTQREATDQMEQLAASSDQARALSEVTNAVAHESQHGGSTMRSHSTSTQEGTSGGGGGGIFGSLLGMPSGSWSSSAASNTGFATSVSYSNGTKDVAAKENQNIQQRTHQHASSARSRRAAVVQETSQSEDETATTRVLTNYNHMHALTVQYYEAIQVYRVQTKPVNHERVLFVPFSTFDFADPRVIARYQDVLYRAALALEASDPTESEDPEPGPVTIGEALEVSAAVEKLKQAFDPGKSDQSAEAIKALQKVFDEHDKMRSDLLKSREPTSARWAQRISNWASSSKPSKSWITLEAQPQEYDGIIKIASISFESENLRGVIVHIISTDGNETRTPDSTIVDLTIYDISTIWAEITIVVDNNIPKTVRITLVLQPENGSPKILSVERQLSGPHERVPIATVTHQYKEDYAATLQHLQENKEYYTRAIWLNVDPLLLSRALMNYQYKDRPLVTTIDPTPIAITGNCLGFVWPFEEGDMRKSVPVYKWHHNADEKHVFLSTDATGHAGWINDGVLFHAFEQATDDFEQATDDAKPVFRYRNNQWWYRYSVHQELNGWEADGVAFYAYDRHSDNTVPLYEVRNSQGQYCYSIQKNDWEAGEPVCFVLRREVSRHVMSEEEQNWRKQFEHEDPRPLYVPLSSGGVFAEAVLGRANSAEKLDITRFWDWHDSPIPILPPDIQAVSMGSRAQPMNLATHSLEAQAAQLQKLQAMPDPQGMQAITQSLMANIFRDMSNARETAETARQGIAKATEASEQAGTNAVETYKAALQHQEAMAQMAIQAAGMMAAPEAGVAGGALGGGGGGLGGLMGGGGGGLGGLLGDGGGALAQASPSHAGAVMNAAAEADQQEAEGGKVGPHTQAALHGLLGGGNDENGGLPALVFSDERDEGDHAPEEGDEGQP